MNITKKEKLISVVIISFLIVLFIKTFIFECYFVSGDSMLPTIHSGDLILINKLSYMFSEPQRGDVVVVKPRVDTGNVVKRIVGMPGERLEIVDGVVTVRNERLDPKTALDERYLNGLTTNEVGTTNIQIDPNEYFVFGDNRQVSIDSRELGPIDRYAILGKASFKISLKGFSFIK